MLTSPKETANRVITGTTDSARGNGRCFNINNKIAFRFDQRNRNGVPGKCIATFYDGKDCGGTAQRNSLNACDRCIDNIGFDLAGPAIFMWNSVRVECGIQQCGTSDFSCGVNGVCGVVGPIGGRDVVERDAVPFEGDVEDGEAFEEEGEGQGSYQLFRG